MPTYEFRCKACGSTFDVKRPMSESSAPAPCPQGHGDTVKLLSMVGVSGLAGNDPQPAGGGGCCGGGCCG
ncbi:zinc ribbon domain-containing protein [Actinosynnema sp. NPDC023587]|uniref:FmdB family zinc ribbon protein n=1 Tax=Actinosynnema sp. NPDC023587 TaxID=3154695 RepID=UPI0033E4E82E